MKEHSILTLDNEDLRSLVFSYLRTIKGVVLTNDSSLKIDAQGNVIVEIDQDIGSDPITTHPESPVLSDGSAKLLSRAIMDVGKLSTKADPETDAGELGCADAVTRILHDECGFAIDKTVSTVELFDELKKAGWQEVETSTPGSVIVSPSIPSMHGHTGIVGESDKIYSNSSATGLWTQNFTVEGWRTFFAKLETHTFIPPSETKGDPIGPIPSPVDTFKALGSQAPIRGTFPIAPSQLRSISTGQFAKYGEYVDAIVDDSNRFHINPLFVLANMANENVNSTYRNPLGISIDDYPFGEPNGRLPNGPRKFSENDWRQAFDRQFALVATGDIYKKCNTIDEWAKVDAPAVAANDPHGTNKDEGKDVGNLYDRLVKTLIELKVA